MSKTVQKSAHSIDQETLALAKRLNKQLALQAYTDFDRARQTLTELDGMMTKHFPFDLRLSYHRHAAFLENQWYHHDKALAHAHLAVSILEGLADREGLLEIWSDIAATLLNQRRWQQAEEAIEKAKRFLDEETPFTLRAHISCREGFFYLHLANYRQALECLMAAENDLLHLDEEDGALKDYYIQTLVFSGLGDLYERLDEKEKSLEAYRKVLPVVERHGLRPRLAWHYLNAGRAELARNDTPKATAAFERVLQVVGAAESEAKTHALSNLGIIAFFADENENALALFDRVADEYAHPVKPDDFTNLSKIEAWRAGVYHKLGNIAETENFLLRAWDAGQQGNDLNHLSEVCSNLGAFHADNADFEAAYDWQQRASVFLRRHFEQLRDHEREELEARHQLERSRQEAQMAKLRVSGLQLRALRAQMNPHFLFNALNAIQGLVTSGRNAEAESYLAKFAKMMRHTLEYSELEVVSLEEEIAFLERYLDINKKLRFREKLDFRIQTPPGADIDDIQVPTMILQPFVENAIEHGLRPKQEGKLAILFELTEARDSIRCIIEDDGVGYNKGRQKQTTQAGFQKHRSRGMDITRERLNLLHQMQKRTETEYVRIFDLGDLSDGKISGTRVEVILPLIDE